MHRPRAPTATRRRRGSCSTRARSITTSASSTRRSRPGSRATIRSPIPASSTTSRRRTARSRTRSARSSSTRATCGTRPRRTTAPRSSRRSRRCRSRRTRRARRRRPRPRPRAAPGTTTTPSRPRPRRPPATGNPPVAANDPSATAAADDGHGAAAAGLQRRGAGRDGDAARRSWPGGRRRRAPHRPARRAGHGRLVDGGQRHGRSVVRVHARRRLHVRLAGAAVSLPAGRDLRLHVPGGEQRPVEGHVRVVPDRPDAGDPHRRRAGTPMPTWVSASSRWRGSSPARRCCSPGPDVDGQRRAVAAGDARRAGGWSSASRPSWRSTRRRRSINSPKKEHFYEPISRVELLAGVTYTDVDSAALMQCVILAGGLATRMRPLTDAIPKALIPVEGKPFVDHQLGWLAAHGVTDVVLSIGYRGELLRDHVGDGGALRRPRALRRRGHRAARDRGRAAAGAGRRGAGGIVPGDLRRFVPARRFRGGVRGVRRARPSRR